jgi:hypothetical protein
MKLKTDFNCLARKAFWSSLFIACLALTACGDDDGGDTPADPDAGSPDATPEPVPDAGGDIDAAPPAEINYEFESRFTPGQSSVNYTGQAMRQVLIAELDGYIERLTDQVESTPPATGDVTDELLFYFEFQLDVSGEVALTLETTPPLLQKVYNDFGGTRQLRDKLAGNDSSTDHKPWNTPGNFLGWSEGGASSDTPTELVTYWFGLLDELAVQRGLGNVPLDPNGTPIAKVYITAKGQDLHQLIQKFLTVGVGFSQGADDYLDDDIAGKGILSPNTQDNTSPYTVLEHAWDEGFGYFGAARDYDQYSDEELSGEGGRAEYQSYHDTSADGFIDVTREYNFSVAVYCAERDRGSVDATDFTKTIFDALVAGRQIIADAADPLTTEQLNALTTQSKIVTSTWEQCLAATVVHYLNETLADMETFGTAEYSFEEHAEHWSEMKGFALGLQFNPDSPMLEGTRFTDFHSRVGDAPVLPNDAGGQTAIDEYKAALQAARAIVQEAYAFTTPNVEAW